MAGAGFGRIGDSAGDDPCFDGSPIGAEACPAESPGSKQQQQQQRNTQQQKHRQRPKSSRQQPTDLLSRLLSKLPWKLKRRHKRQLAVAAELFIGLAMSGFMAWAVVAVLQRVMKVSEGVVVKCEWVSVGGTCVRSLGMAMSCCRNLRGHDC